MELVARIYAHFELATVISQSMADQIWPGEDPIGKTFQIGQPEMKLPKMRVIGVVGNTTQVGAERGESVEYYCAAPAMAGDDLAAPGRAHAQDPLGAAASLRRRSTRSRPANPSSTSN